MSDPNADDDAATLQDQCDKLFAIGDNDPARWPDCKAKIEELLAGAVRTNIRPAVILALRRRVKAFDERLALAQGVESKPPRGPHG